jgi:hypothetical protein
MAMMFVTTIILVAKRYHCRRIAVITRRWAIINDWLAIIYRRWVIHYWWRGIAISADINA